MKRCLIQSYRFGQFSKMLNYLGNSYVENLRKIPRGKPFTLCTPWCWTRMPVTAQRAAERFCPFPTGTGPETQPPQKTPRQTVVSNSVCAHREETGTERGNLNITVLWLFKSPGNFILFCFGFFLISVNYKTKTVIYYQNSETGVMVKLFNLAIKYPTLLLLFERNEHINAWWLKSLINLIFW